MLTIDEAISHCEKVADMCSLTDGDRQCEEDHRQLAEWLKELKELREQQQWIPCSERLAEEGKPVLGTFKGQGGNFCLTTERMIMNGREIWSAACGLKPVAWMPLPDPYKPEN